MDVLRIDPAAIRHAVPRSAVGLNVNFLADHAEMRSRGQGYLAALRQMGVRSLRYPGGEKSNEYFWSQPPWTKPRPTLSLTGPEARLFVESKQHVTADGAFCVQPMDFDEFMALCQDAGAEPMVCVGLGSAYVQSRPGRLSGSTRAQVFENTVEWVRYANRVRGYGVRYWEIGNESYWRGSVAAIKAADYTRDVIEFSRAMKAVDPSIQIGVNGHVDQNFVSHGDDANGPIWWEYLLSRAAADIDFVVVHPYPCFEWGGYEHFIHNAPVFTGAVDQAIAALEAWASPADAARIRVMATETNAFDWAASKWYQGDKAGWAWANDAGHALVLFEILGQHLTHPRVDGVQVWNSRWFGSPSRLEDVLDDQNELLPTGHAIGLWGLHLRTRLTALPAPFAGPAYASYSPNDQALTLFLMNKQLSAQSVSVELENYAPRWRATGTVFAGKSPADLHPTIRPAGEWQAPPASSLRATLPPISLTSIDISAVS